MSIEFACSCGKAYRVDESLAGRKSRCKQCQAVIVVPQPVVTAIEVIDESDDLADVYRLETPAESASYGTSGRLPAVLDKNTVASLPAQLGLEWGKYLASFPQMPLAVLAASLLSLLLAVLVHAGFALGAPLVLGVGWLLMRKQKLKFIYGDVSPALVVGKDPWLVAVYTNLASSPEKFCPCLKIIRQPLDRMTDGPPRIGMPLATAAFYVNGGLPGYWADFEPTVIHCATSDRAAIEHTMARIPESLWQSLKVAVDQAPELKPGLYTLWDNNTLGGKHRGAPAKRTLSYAATAALVLVGVFFKIEAQRQRAVPAPQAAAAPQAPAPQIPVAQVAVPQVPVPKAEPVVQPQALGRAAQGPAAAPLVAAPSAVDDEDDREPGNGVAGGDRAAGLRDPTLSSPLAQPVSAAAQAATGDIAAQHRERVQKMQEDIRAKQRKMREDMERRRQEQAEQRRNK